MDYAPFAQFNQAFVIQTGISVQRCGEVKLPLATPVVFNWWIRTQIWTLGSGLIGLWTARKMQN